MRDAQPGIYFGLPEEDYHKRELGVVSNSAMGEVLKSQAHYAEWLESGGKTTDDMAFGKMLHCATLEPERFESEYVVAPDFGDMRFKANKEKRAEWLAENAGKIEVSAVDHEKLTRMAHSIAEHPIASRILRGGSSEVTLVWDDDDGVRCKLRADYWLDAMDVCVDLKKMRNASPRGFSRSVAEYGYHRQRAFYGRGFAALGKPLRQFIFVAVEDSAPYNVGVYCLDDEALEVGEREALEGMRRIRECAETGQFPGYGDGIQTLSLPRWKVKESGNV